MAETASTRDVTLTLTCPAKINLALSVAPLDATVMHPIASWMVALEFGDTLTLERQTRQCAMNNKQNDKHSAVQSHLKITYANDAPIRGIVDWPLEKDLAWRAHQLLEREAGEPLPVSANLVKRIPTGAGLGGGSSDAAAMLAGLNHLFALDFSTTKLCTLSQQLGSDVTYLTAAVLGQPSALVTGLGEIITPCPMTETLHVVLIFPGVACPTGPVYKAYDQALLAADSSPLQHADVGRVKALMALESVAELCEHLFNDLAEPACVVQPILREIQRKAALTAGRAVHVTGSGATLFTLADDEKHAQKLASKLRQSLGLSVLATCTL